jgi:hypothetical protein
MPVFQTPPVPLAAFALPQLLRNQTFTLVACASVNVIVTGQRPRRQRMRRVTPYPRTTTT